MFKWIGILMMVIGAALGSDAPLTCRTTNNGIYQTKAQQFQHEINRLRSQVATGNAKNQDGKALPAANMNVLVWSGAFAKRAQNCADKCPLSETTCSRLADDYGYVTYRKSVTIKSQPLNIAEVIAKWMTQKDKASQLLFARQSQFGCGRAVEESSKFEYVVCFFDKKFSSQSSSPPYVDGIAGSACQISSRKYTGLCATGHSHGQQLISQGISSKGKHGKKVRRKRLVERRRKEKKQIKSNETQVQPEQQIEIKQANYVQTDQIVGLGLYNSIDFI